MSYACVSAQPQWILNIPPYENHLTIQKVLCMSSNGLCLTTVVELISWGCVGGCCFNSANTTAGVSSSLHKTRVRLTRMGLIAGGHCSRRYQPAFKLPPPPPSGFSKLGVDSWIACTLCEMACCGLQVGSGSSGPSHQMFGQLNKLWILMRWITKAVHSHLLFRL